MCFKFFLFLVLTVSFLVNAFNIPVRYCSVQRSFTSTNERPNSKIGRVVVKASVVDEAVETTPLSDAVLNTIGKLKDESNEYAAMFGLSPAVAAFYALFAAVRDTPVPLGLKGDTFCLRHGQIEKALQQETNWPGFFTMNDLEKAVNDDFLDAARGSTDNRKGWKITDVSVPRGESFEEARMTFDDVQNALEKGTVILNAAGAHIPKLAGPSLACTDATLLPCALNLYVTAAGKRTSAPPHTDKQDVMVVQTSGRKHWKVYSPPEGKLKPNADVFARGKGDDSMPLYSMEETSELLLETTINPGDVIFIPAGFPHTTSTVTDDDASQDTSVHLTLGIDHHIWELDYLSARRLALRRAGVKDTVLGKFNDEDNPFTGTVNQLPRDLWADILAELPLGLLDEDDKVTSLIDFTTTELKRIAQNVDPETASKVNDAHWRETVERFRQEGRELLEIHRDMYLAAIEEGQTREAEEAMTAHLSSSGPRATMSPERIQRLSVFRVKRFYDQINDSKQSLKEWSFETVSSSSDEGDESGKFALAVDWAFTMPVKVGDEVEADLGGAFFPATVTRASGGTYDVSFFDGDRETGLSRNQIKLLSPPAIEPSSLSDVDTSKMTAKQLKRWKKQQEKLKKKGLA